MLGDDGKRRVSRWFGASLLLFILATAAIFLLWRGDLLLQDSCCLRRQRVGICTIGFGFCRVLATPLGCDLRGNWIGEVKTWG